MVCIVLGKYVKTYPRRSVEFWRGPAYTAAVRISFQRGDLLGDRAEIHLLALVLFAELFLEVVIAAECKEVYIARRLYEVREDAATGGTLPFAPYFPHIPTEIVAKIQKAVRHETAVQLIPPFERFHIPAGEHDKASFFCTPIPCDTVLDLISHKLEVRFLFRLLGNARTIFVLYRQRVANPTYERPQAHLPPVHKSLLSRFLQFFYRRITCRVCAHYIFGKQHRVLGDAVEYVDIAAAFSRQQVTADTPEFCGDRAIHGIIHGQADRRVKEQRSEHGDAAVSV